MYPIRTQENYCASTNCIILKINLMDAFPLQIDQQQIELNPLQFEDPIVTRTVPQIRQTQQIELGFGSTMIDKGNKLDFLLHSG